MTLERQFAGGIPQAYDRYMGPLIFRPYAEDMARRLAGFTGDLLEVAAGTGIVTRALDRALPSSARITATDISQPMLDYAAARLGSPRVSWRTADGQALPFADESFDAVVCQFGVMFFPDRRLGYREALRVLRPGGRYVFSTWDHIEANEATAVVQAVVEAHFPDDPPDFMVRLPHGYHDPQRIREDAAAAGFAKIQLETTTLRARAPSARDITTAICQGTPLRNEIEARDPKALPAVTEAARQALTRRFGSGAIDTQMRAHVVTAFV